jgi:hypothetical protein
MSPSANFGWQIGTWARFCLYRFAHTQSKLLRSGIDSQYLHKIGDLAKMVQGIPCGLIVSAQKVHVKDVLPWPPAHGPRLDLAEADIAQREHAQRLEEGPGYVFYFKSDGTLVSAGLREAGARTGARRIP